MLQEKELVRYGPRPSSLDELRLHLDSPVVGHDPELARLENQQGLSVLGEVLEHLLELREESRRIGAVH